MVWIRTRIESGSNTDQEHCRRDPWNKFCGYFFMFNVGNSTVVLTSTVDCTKPSWETTMVSSREGGWANFANTVISALYPWRPIKWSISQNSTFKSWYEPGLYVYHSVIRIPTEIFFPWSLLLKALRICYLVIYIGYLNSKFVSVTKHYRISYL